MINDSSYNKLISKTFCDNAIRTVLMIDDQYVPYHKLLDLTKEETDLNTLNSKLGISEQAALMQKFFEEKQFICDVSDGADGFDPEKARKSDLIVLDYHLEYENPKPTLEILNKLSCSSHMNLVVLYTAEDLEKTWLQISTSLKGGIVDDETELFTNNEFKELWEEKIEFENGIPNDWDILNHEDLSNQLLNKKHTNIVRKGAADLFDNANKKFSNDLIAGISNLQLKNFDLLNLPKPGRDIVGNFIGAKWLKIGNVFIAFYKKIPGTDDSKEIWGALNEALIQWQPNYYRLISSEIQNRIENDGIVFSRYLEPEYLEQASWLWQLLKLDSNYSITDFLDNNHESFRDRIIYDEDLNNFANSVLETFSDNFPKDESEDEQIKFAIENTSKSLNSNDQALPSKVVHALNKSLSTKEFLSEHITTGTLLTDEDKDDWYLCVSPACDAMPKQNNSCISKRLNPNYKMLKFLKLKKIKQKSALEKAEHGKCLFLEEDKTLWVDELPNIEYAFVHNGSRTYENVFKVSFLNRNDSELIQEEKSLRVKAQLKEEYAARFQALTSHHVGRIGVDFIQYPSRSEDE